MLAERLQSQVPGCLVAPALQPGNRPPNRAFPVARWADRAHARGCRRRGQPSLRNSHTTPTPAEYAGAVEDSGEVERALRTTHRTLPTPKTASRFPGRP